MAQGNLLPFKPLLLSGHQHLQRGRTVPTGGHNRVSESFRVDQMRQVGWWTLNILLGISCMEASRPGKN